jgi:hypothetical protein
VPVFESVAVCFTDFTQIHEFGFFDKSKMCSQKVFEIEDDSNADYGSCCEAGNRCAADVLNGSDWDAL